MSTRITVGHLQAHQKFTGRLFFQPTGDNGYIDLGNVVDYKDATDQQTRTRMSSANGFRIVDDEQVDVRHTKYEFTLDEVGDRAGMLLALADTATTSTVSATTAPSGTSSHSSVILGRSYFVGAVNVDTFVLKKGATTLVLNTDYTVNLKTGMFTLLTTGSTVANGDSVTSTFGNPARSYETWTGHAAPLHSGTIRFEETGQHTKEPAQVITGTAVMNVTSFPEQKGEFARFVVRVTFTAAPTIKRQYAE